MRRVLVGLVACVLLVAPGCAALLDDAPEPLGEEAGATGSALTSSGVPVTELLLPVDVETVSGLSGLTVVSRDSAAGARGDVNIATTDGQLVVVFVVGDLETWHGWLTDGSTVGESVDPPVGEESFLGPSPDVSPTVYLFGFRKGEAAALIETFFDENGEVILSTEQLRALAQIVADRL